MSKLFKLKEWLLVGDAARHLSLAFGENVTDADVFRLALDGHLTLSVHLVNGAYARWWVPIEQSEVEWEEVPSLDGKGIVQLVKDGPIWRAETGPLMRLLRPITSLEPGVWDLPMIGPERIDVEWAYQQLAGGPDYTMCTLDGVLVASTTGGLYQIQAHFSDNEHFDKSRLNVPYEHADNFYPAGSLPEDSVFVVRTSALSRLMRTLANTEMVNADAKPLATKERNTLLTIIGVLATMAELDISKTSKAGEVIESEAAKLGVSLSRRGVMDHLNRVSEAMAARGT